MPHFALLLLLLTAPLEKGPLDPEWGPLDDLVLRVAKPPVSYKTQPPVSYEAHSQLTLHSNGVVKEIRAPSLRPYTATLEGCYDGDTCSFEVRLSPTSDSCDFGLGVGVHSDPNRPVQCHFIAGMLNGPTDFLLDDLPTNLVKKNQHVRLCDIDAPELHPGPNKAAMKSRDDLVRWIQSAKKLELQVPQDAHGDMYDKYGRLLVYVVADGVNLNQQQLKAKNAVPFMKCQ